MYQVSNDVGNTVIRIHMYYLIMKTHFFSYNIIYIKLFFLYWDEKEIFYFSILKNRKTTDFYFLSIFIFEKSKITSFKYLITKLNDIKNAIKFAFRSI